MSQGDFPQLAIATRRQIALLSHRTFTTERRARFDAVLRLSFDLGRAEASVPSQAWLARILGMSKGDVSRSEKSLVGFGMIAVRVTGLGPDKRRFYKPQPDVTAWAGEGFGWRIADPQARARAIFAECQLATYEASCHPAQSKLPLEFVPTITEELNLHIESAKIDSAIEMAGALPTAHHPSPPPGRAHQTIGKLTVAVLRAIAVPRNCITTGLTVGHPANEQTTGASFATATRPSQGKQTLAKRRTLPTDCWLSSQRASPAPAGSSLYTRPTFGGKLLSSS